MSGPYLLDTSAILWAVTSPAYLSQSAKRAINSRAIVMSVASYWEVIVKSKKGQLSIGDPISWWGRAAKDLLAEVLSIRTNHVAALYALPEHHKDPFDRMLIAQAIADGLTLVTSDELIHRYPVRVLW
jgi:PIN domain nuclease of toxin-antitoxin system